MMTALLAQAQQTQVSLAPGGWVIMLVSAGSVTGVLGWCLYRILTTPGSTEHIHSQADIHPDDWEEE